ncbi:MAG: cytochrome-c peroxidase [Oceanospirillaceae bacterium]|nr:cytochrome-c peroxidase [Oceanospirillaceae bacterium]
MRLLSIFFLFPLTVTSVHAELDLAYSSEAIAPLPTSLDVNRLQADLGEKLFNDPILSEDGTIACSSCHQLNNAGVDSRQVSVGINGALGEMNAPTVYNAVFNFVQFWDGRSTSLEEQAEFPINSPIEMGSSWTAVVKRLSERSEYREQFKYAFNDGEVNPANISAALAEFQKRLITPNSRFDRFLKGDKNAISELEQQGYERFKRYGCVSCHNGVNVGGNMFAKLGLVRDFFGQRAEIHEHDLGRYNITGREEDRYVFKVPSLRNVALTAPYLHDGSMATLEDVVNGMAKYQLGRRLPSEDLDLILAFLQTLTGERQ